MPFMDDIAALVGTFCFVCNLLHAASARTTHPNNRHIPGSDPASVYETVIRRVGRFSISKIEHDEDKDSDGNDEDTLKDTTKDEKHKYGIKSPSAPGMGGGVKQPPDIGDRAAREAAVRAKILVALPPPGPDADEDAAIKLAAATAVDELLAAYAAAAAEEEEEELESDLSGSSGSASGDKENNNPSNDDESLDELAFEEEGGCQPDEACGAVPPVSILPLICGHCNYRSTSQRDLINHMNTCNNGRPFPCKYCNYSCGNKRDLREHEKLHKESKFVCDICGKLFRDPMRLDAHRDAHVGSITCSLCGLSFQTHRSFNDHVRSLHPERGSTGGSQSTTRQHREGRSTSAASNRS
ncbi:gastrula zinc finger protein-like [Tropilaelaps mercedesae]|uniref:Gastrula zinc finger protein-like n=1 Tax=Tropilaelaps mercedesae TaxID=418985 RepID=A0A1V9XGP4_9ACAR|nr:gastrula zinc finger protein-like [Tropilaelaps mercedesae]